MQYQVDPNLIFGTRQVIVTKSQIGTLNGIIKRLYSHANLSHATTGDPKIAPTSLKTSLFPLKAAIKANQGMLKSSWCSSLNMYK